MEEQRERPERINLRDIYEVTDRLEKKVNESFATKSELRMWVVIGIAGGQGLAAVVTSMVTNSSPVAQAAWVYARVRGIV